MEIVADVPHGTNYLKIAIKMKTLVVLAMVMNLILMPIMAFKKERGFPFFARFKRSSLR